jgi:hypothetical protein
VLLHRHFFGIAPKLIDKFIGLHGIRSNLPRVECLSLKTGAEAGG